MDVAPSVVFQFFLLGKELVSDTSCRQEWPCFATHSPASLEIPSFVTIHDTTPILYPRSMRGFANHQQYGIQVQIKSVEYASAREKAHQLWHACMNAASDVVLMDSRRFSIDRVFASSGIFPIGMDESGSRHFLTFNITAIIKEI